jgi:hypothetical protein
VNSGVGAHDHHDHDVSALRRQIVSPGAAGGNDLEDGSAAGS